jgi:hypothetical protein
MTTSKARAQMDALRRVALEDLEVTSDAELRAEAIADGENVDVLVTTIAASIREAVAGELRQRLVSSRERLTRTTGARVAARVFPAIDQLKALVQRAFEAQPDLAMAFRDGKRQSDADWHTLYEDLIELGAIEPDGDDH